MGRKSGVAITQDRVRELLGGVTQLTQRQLLVGIPEDRSPREPGDGHGAAPDISNAALGYIHEHGAPEVGIPPRPFLVPGVNLAQEKIAARMDKAGRAALDGDAREVSRQFQSCGIEVVDVIVTRMEEGLSPALADGTRRHRDGGASKEDLDARKPLIDTGQLRNSIAWVERVKGEKVAEGAKEGP